MIQSSQELGELWQEFLDGKFSATELEAAPGTSKHSAPVTKSNHSAAPAQAFYVEKKSSEKKLQISGKNKTKLPR